MDTLKNIIWQPTHLYQPHPSFEILLSRSFAVKMVGTILSLEAQYKMNELGAEIASSFKYREPSPYIFHKNTAFVRQININGGKGIWLAVEGLFGKAPDLSKKEPLKYQNNNMESSFDTLCLLSLFDHWISYSGILEGAGK